MVSRTTVSSRSASSVQNACRSACAVRRSSRIGAGVFETKASVDAAYPPFLQALVRVVDGDGRIATTIDRDGGHRLNPRI